MIIPRSIEPTLLRLARQYPVVTLTGPRQSGKTTLVRSAFPDLPYVNLESPDQREFASRDPRGFLRQLGRPAILDEIQRVPSLTSFIQPLVDEVDDVGLYILTGSAQFEVAEQITQSLAGRTGLLRLLPFSIEEARCFQERPSVERLLHAGFYPRIHARHLDPTQALGDYFETYVERDVRQISVIRHLTTFQRFLRLCAGRVGQLLNLQSLGNDVGVSHTTARDWLSVLEASDIVHLLRPYHGNLSKRLIKSPKLYFYDVGLAAYLLGIENESQVVSHPLRGPLFENLVVMEALKFRYHLGKRSNLHFFRDSAGHEVDLVYSRGHEPIPIEIKAGETIASDFFGGLRYFEALLDAPVPRKVLVYAGEATREQEGIQVCNHLTFWKRLEDLEAPAG